MPRNPYATRPPLTHNEYTALLAQQGGGCAICGNPPKTRKLHLDHDHRTGEIRGLLCYRCNRFLHGWMTPAWLLAAARYLARCVYCGGEVEAPVLTCAEHRDLAALDPHYTYKRESAG